MRPHTASMSAPSSLGMQLSLLVLAVAVVNRWPNPSVKGTSCAKAQAAPYVER
jgi:hypothetical protein